MIPAHLSTNTNIIKGLRPSIPLRSASVSAINEEFNPRVRARRLSIDLWAGPTKGDRRGLEGLPPTRMERLLAPMRRSRVCSTNCRLSSAGGMMLTSDSFLVRIERFGSRLQPNGQPRGQPRRGLTGSQP
jgi:hypothetical protein